VIGWTAVVALLAALAAVPAAAQGVDLEGLEGGALRQGDLTRGKTVLVIWASWSPRCRDIVERVNALVNRWGGQARVVAVSFQEERGDVRQFLAGKSLKASVYLDVDGSFSKKNAITSLPGLVVVVDGDSVYAGKLPEDPDRLLSDLLG
jgi:thiol-disulfide isomerase/thioredoxin